MADATTSRSRGLLLIGAGALAFVGTTTQMLPAEAFFPALGACLLGVLLFMKGNRVATEQEEQRIRRGLDPELRNRTADAYAARQARADGRAIENLATLEAGRRPAPESTTRAEPIAADEIVLQEVAAPGSAVDDNDDAAFVVTTDVSFPVEERTSGTLAEQLEKLDRLRDAGVLTAEEFAIAKAKLLG